MLLLYDTLEQLNDLIAETRSTLYITTSHEVLVNNKILQLSVLRKLANGFYQLLNGNIIPDLIGFRKIESVFNELRDGV